MFLFNIDCIGRRVTSSLSARHSFKMADDAIVAFKDLLLKKLEVIPLFIWLMTPNGAIWSLDQRTVIMR